MPRLKASVGRVSVVSPSWLELLQGEELAHVSVEPPRTGTTEPFPDELEPRVASALVPYAPAAANAFRSAWMPAPPPESDVAMLKTRGTLMDSLRRYEPDQVRRV